MMKNSTFIKSFFLLLCMIAGVGSAWADEVTYTFTAKNWSATIGDDEANWTSSKDGNQFQNGRGVQITTGASGATAKSNISFSNVSEIVVTYSTNASKGAGSIGITIGDNDEVSQSVTTAGGTTDRTLTYSFNPEQTGLIQLSVTCSTNSIYIKSIKITYSAGGGGDTPTELEDNDLALTGAPIALNFDLYNNATAQTIHYTTSSTGEVSVESGAYDVSCYVDNANKTITVTPMAVTNGSQTVTVNQAADDTYKAGSVTFTVTVTDSTPIPTHTATFSVNGVTSTQEYEEGAAITFPADPEDVYGKTFVGWVTEAIESTTNDAPTFVTSATMGQSDITFYAVFAYANGSGSSDVIDVLTHALIGVTGTSYTDWSGKSATSDAIYAGNSAGGSKNTNPSIQLRSNNNNSGIVTTTSGGKVKKVTVDWNQDTADGRTLNVYGNNSPYTAASNLYNNSNQGTLIGTIVYGTSTELTIEGDYEYIGIRSASSAMYLDEVQITWSTGGGVSYSDYCTTVVAAAVERPVITVAQNPFVISTTATITCETEGATIKYSFDGENWDNYEDALTITATTTLYAKAVKDENESTIASVTITKNLAEPTVTIDAEGITNTNVFDGTAAGSLAASVTYNDAAVEGAEVTWSGDNDDVATINAETGAVTLVGAGTVTFTATYAGNSDYAEKTATYEMTVTNTDPNAPGTENNPYTVSQITATENGVYVQGIISSIDEVSTQYHNATYKISEDGTTTNEFTVFRGKYLNNTNFTSVDQISVGDAVVIYGDIDTYQEKLQLAQGNYLVSLVRKVATPTFDPESGEVMAGSTVTINTTTEDATIYYTVDGTEPTTESTEYTEPITVDADMTIKAIAVKDGMTNSNVATATYTIDLTPSIVFDGNQNPLNVSYNAYNTNVHYVASNTTGDITLVVCDEQGNAATYEWFSAEITSNVYVHVTLQANEDTENARTAYFKLVADNAESEIFAITQAKFVADYATLPFAFDGGRANIETTSGLTQDGLDSDYASSPKLKFNDTGDYVILKLNERPGILTFDIKGNSFSNSTFKVQTSADGEAYTDLETYTNLGNTQSEEFDNLDENVRYIKWIYTNKNSGNVALGNITMAKYETPSADPEITVAPAEVNVDAAEHDGTLDLTYANLTISDMDDFVIQYYNGEGEETSEPDWIEVVVAEQDPQIGEGYVVSFYTIENEGEARTAYFKVYAMDDETNLVYSNLVTVTQAAYVAPGVTDNYALFTGELIEGDYIIYYDGYAMKNTVESDRLSYEEMTPVNDVITTDNAAIVWHIAKSGDYWTIYNADAEAYAASTGAKNKAQMLADGTDDKALWTVSRYGDAYEFVNKKNSDANVNAYLRNNGTFGFACYALTTGGDLTLYKKVIPVTGEATITLNAACTDGEFVYGTYSNASAFVVPSDLTVSEIAIIDGTLLVEEYSTGAVVPANTGVMVAATAGGDYTVDLTSDAGKSVLGDDNRLRATGAGISAEEMGADTDCVFYRLTMHKGTDLGFWWGAAEGGAFEVGANKAYLAVPETVGARIQGFSFEDGIVTGIANMNREAMINNGSVYNMKGQRVAQPAKGLYIQNGKKVVVK